MPVKLPKETKEKIVQALSYARGSVELQCDGYKIDLQVEKKTKGLSYHIAIYINGLMKSDWVLKDEDFPERKFLSVKVQHHFSPAKKKKLIKEFGVRRAKEYFDLDGKIEYVLPWFASGTAAINHLCRVCDSVVYVEKISAPARTIEEILADIRGNDDN
jgi:hypothetical protein